MSKAIFRREELMTAALHLGGVDVDLADYATTGLRVVAVGPSGIGKTNAGLLIAEQLADQGWICVLVDPEGEIESLYGDAVANPEALAGVLARRDKPFVVVSARDASEFVEYGEVILAAADEHRKPIFLVIDEGQVFSSSKRRKKGGIGGASDIVDEFVERGRKRALDLFLTAHRFSGSLNRSVFNNKNLTLIGCQEDPTAWSALAPQFRSSKIGFGELQALAPGEFFCFSRRGVEKVVMPMAAALKRVAPKARQVRPALPTTFSQWDRAMREIPKPRLQSLTAPIAALLGTVAGLTTQQLLSGERALRDELEARA